MTDEKDPHINPNLVAEIGQHIKANFENLEEVYYNTKGELDKLFSVEHENIGRLLKCHLIIEHYLDRFLEQQLKLPSNNDGGFRFYQKIILIESADPGLKVILTGVKEINKVRNKFAHKLDYSIQQSEIKFVKGISDGLFKMALKDEKPKAVIEQIECFTSIFCHMIDEHSTEKGRQNIKERQEIIKKYI